MGLRRRWPGRRGGPRAGCLLSILFNRTLPARSKDADRDGILDVADPIAILRHFFFGGESPHWGAACVAIGGCLELCLPMTGARAAILALCALAALPQLPGQDDCNQNGVDDAQDIAAGTSRDCNGNGVPDECDLAPTHLQFQPRRRSRVVTQPREFLEELVPGDFDGDGRIDLVVEVNGLNNVGNRVSILLGSGDGAFGEPRTVLPLPSRGGLAAADLDGDGKLDLTVGAVQNGSVLYVLHGNGDGTFRKPRAVTFGSNAGTVQGADLDMDGDVDLVVSNEWDDGIAFFKNAGTGVFQATILRPPKVDFQLTFFLLAADFDNDGDIDLVTPRDPAGGVTLLRNRGNATFEEVPAGDATTFYGPPFLGDFDGDGDLDLLGPGGDLLPNRGDGTFDPQAPTGLAAGTEFASYFGVAGDVDRDGDLDLVLSGGVTGALLQALHIARNRGGGTFGPVDKVPLDAFARPAAVLDLNADGVPDVLSEDSTGSILVLLGLPQEGAASPDVNANDLPDECEPDCDRDGLPDAFAVAARKAPDCNRNGIPDSCDVQALVAFERGDCLALGGFPPFDAAAADLDGNGSLDFAILEDLRGDANPSPNVFEALSRLEVDLGRGDGTFEQGQLLDFGSPTLPPLMSLAAGDLDGDGYPDLAGTQALRGSAIVLMNDTIGAFSKGGEFPAAVQFPGKVFALDLDGDGRIDLLVEGGGNNDDRAAVLINQGGARFSRGRTYPSPGEIVATADLDEDGAPDFVSEDRSGFVHASWNDGRGGFQAGSRIAPGGLLAAADLDGDRKVDLAIDDPSALERRVLRNAGGRAFERGAVIQRFENYGRFVVLDADGDQDPDLVGFSGESKLAVLPGNGRGAFAPPFLLDGGLPNQGRLRFPADFNGDGQIDVVVLAPGCLLSILFNRTLPARSKDADRDGIPDECPAAAGGQIPADANQDGKLDLSDAVWVLNRLFRGAASPWPCDGGLDPSPAPADVRLLDSNGDGALDVADPIALLRHFFFGGEPPALGTRCVAITGCPERCIG